MSMRSTDVEEIQVPTPLPSTVICLGASFDPPHFGHAAMACLAVRFLTANLRQTVPAAPTEQPVRAPAPPALWLLPSLNRPDKSPVAPLEERFLWCQGLARGLRQSGVNACVSRAEVDFHSEFRGTVTFLRALRAAHPDVTFVFLCGEDSLRSLNRWRDPHEHEPNGLLLLEQCPVLVVPRPPHHSAESPRPPWFSDHRVTLLPELSTLDAEFQTKHGLRGSLATLASTHIRTSFARNECPKGYVYADLEHTIAQSAQRLGCYTRC